MQISQSKTRFQYWYHAVCFMRQCDCKREQNKGLLLGLSARWQLWHSLFLNSSPPHSALSDVLKCHIQRFFTHFQEWQLHHFSGQSFTVLYNPSGGKKVPNKCITNNLKLPWCSLWPSPLVLSCWQLLLYWWAKLHTRERRGEEHEANSEDFFFSSWGLSWS